MGIYLAMYSDKVSSAEALFISLFAMSIVFIVLLIISYMIDITAFAINKNTKKEKAISKVASVNTDVKNDTSDTTLVAIIAAAVASMMNVSVDDIRITKIKRINQNGSAWTEKGLLDKMN